MLSLGMPNSLFLYPTRVFSFFISTIIVSTFKSFIVFLSGSFLLFLMCPIACSLLWLYPPWVVRVNAAKTDPLKVGLLEKDLAAWKTPWKPATIQCLRQSILVNLKAWPVALWPCQGMGCTFSSKNTELTDPCWSQNSATSYCYCIIPKPCGLQLPNPRSGSSLWCLALCYPKPMHFT